MAAKKKKNKKKKMVKRVILGYMQLFLLQAAFIAGPKAFAILRMSRIAKAFVIQAQPVHLKRVRRRLYMIQMGTNCARLKAAKICIIEC